VQIRENANERKGMDVKPFPPYVLQHTALTSLGELGCDVFTLARIAGHSNISITQRYVHPQTGAIQRAFDNLEESGGHNFGRSSKIPLLKAGRKSSARAIAKRR
jgi:integrase